MTTTNDREWAFLAEATGEPGPFNDMYFKYLRGLGYTGTLQDMIAKNGGGLTPSKGGGFSLDAFMAAQSDGIWINANDPATLWQDTAGTIAVENAGETIARPDDQRNGAGSPHTINQATASFQPKYQTGGGALFDALDDNWLTDYYANVTAGGPELVTNGGFDSGVAGWVATNGATIENVAGELRITAGATSFPTATMTIPTVIGKTYSVSVKLRRGTSASNVNLSIKRGDGSSTYFILSNSTTSDQTLTQTFVALDTSSQITLYMSSGTSAGQTGFWDNVSVKEVTNQDNFIVAKVTVPASLSGTQAVAGVGDFTAGRCYLGVSNAGRMLIGAGSGTVYPSVDIDLRGRTVVLGMALNGSTVRGFVDGLEVLNGAQPSAVPTSYPFTIGAANGSSRNFFFGGTIHSLIAGREFIDLAKFKQIASKL